MPTYLLSFSSVILSLPTLPPTLFFPFRPPRSSAAKRALALQTPSNRTRVTNGEYVLVDYSNHMQQEDMVLLSRADSIEIIKAVVCQDEHRLFQEDPCKPNFLGDGKRFNAAIDELLAHAAQGSDTHSVLSALRRTVEAVQSAVIDSGLADSTFTFHHPKEIIFSLIGATNQCPHSDLPGYKSDKFVDEVVIGAQDSHGKTPPVPTTIIASISVPSSLLLSDYTLGEDRVINDADVEKALSNHEEADAKILSLPRARQMKRILIPVWTLLAFAQVKIHAGDVAVISHPRLHMYIFPPRTMRTLYSSGVTDPVFPLVQNVYYKAPSLDCR